MDLNEISWQDVDWIDLAQNKDKWGTFVHAVINFGLHKMRRISLLPEDLGFSRKTLFHGVS